MYRIHCSRRTQVALAIAATIAAAVVGLAIKLGSDMAGYLETSVAHSAEDVALGTAAAPAMAQVSRDALGPAAVADPTATETGTAGDAAELRTDGSVASVR